MKNQLKVILAGAIFSFLALTSYGQTSEHRWSWLVYAGVNQYDGDLGSEAFELGTGTFQGGFGFRRFMSPSINLGFDAGFGTLDFQDNGNQFDADLAEFEILGEYKFYNGSILSEDAKLRPYITAGLGINSLEDQSFYIPVGAGLRYYIFPDFSLQLSSIYSSALADDAPSYLQTSFGLYFNISNDAQPTPSVRVIDTDGDGINDPLDKCPTEAGPVENNGCPIADADGDGIPDAEDECPNTAGIADFNGCPDTDGDGIKDSEDKCPNEAGTEANGGCPDTDGDGVIDKDDECPNEAGTLNGCPDQDNDGVKDADDLCPTEAGILANKGCPEVDEEVKQVLAQALSGIQFESGRDVIKRSSYPILDNVVKVMNDHPEFKLEISGYTDNTGRAESNLSLSDRRAKAARQYLIDKGIDGSRMTAKGYGIADPIADNNTAAGRAKNRRVEFKVVF
ncbi:MAG: OmpA family protein [Bacteroidota bacterium]